MKNRHDTVVVQSLCHLWYVLEGKNLARFPWLFTPYHPNRENTIGVSPPQVPPEWEEYLSS